MAAYCWSNTKRVVMELHALLFCGVCKKTLREPLCLGCCEHYFCCLCAEAYLGKACPVCGVPSRVKDVQPNRQLGAATSLCEELMALLGLTVDASDLNPDDDRISVTLPQRPAKEDKHKEMTALLGEKCTSAVQKRKRSNAEINLKVVARKRWKRSRDSIEDTENESRELQSTLSDEMEDTETHHPEMGKEISMVNGDSDLSITETEGEGKSTTKLVSQRKLRKQMDNFLNLKGASLHIKDTDNKLSKANLSADLKQTEDEKKQNAVSITSTEYVRNEQIRRRSLPRGTVTVEKFGQSDLETHSFKHKDVSANPSTRKKCNTEAVLPSPASGTNADTSSATKRRSVQATSLSRNNKSADEKLHCFKDADSVGEFPAPETKLETSSCLSSPGRFLSSLFSTPKSSEKPLSGKKLKSPITYQKQTSFLGSPETSVISPSPNSAKAKTKKSPRTPNSIQGSTVKRNGKGETRLHVACIKGELDIVRFLLEEGENPNVRDFANWTPLHEACNHGHVKIAELLLNHGAMINVPGGENSTPLHDSVQNYRLDCVRLLVSRGASKTLRDLHGKTPVDLAWTSEMKEALNVPAAVINSPIFTPSSSMVSTQPQSLALLTTGLDAASKSLLMEYAEKLNWKVVNDFSAEVTHLVTSANKDGVCMRTIKYLQAVLTGKWIVKFEWVLACAKSASHVDEELFEITGSTHSPNSYAPRKGRQCISQQLPLLFNGCHFYFCGDFSHPSPSKEDLSNLVKLGSGLVLGREPKQEAVDQSELIVPYHAEPLSCLANCAYFTVVCQADRELTMSGTRICRITSSWILSSIAKFRLLNSP